MGAMKPPADMQAEYAQDRAPHLVGRVGVEGGGGCEHGC